VGSYHTFAMGVLEISDDPSCLVGFNLGIKTKYKLLFKILPSINFSAGQVLYQDGAVLVRDWLSNLGFNSS
jgi:hypothetical protein